MQSINQSAVSDILSRSSTAYFAEAFIAIILFFIFAFYARSYQRHFLTIWAYSWLAFFTSMVVVGMVTLNWNTQSLVLKNAGSYVYIVANIAQVFLLLVGSYELINKKEVSRSFFVWCIVSIGAFGLLIVFPYMWIEDMASVRYLLRVGIKYLIVIIGFTVAGLIMLRSPKLSIGIGRKLIAGSFFLYGLYHVYYLAIVIANTFYTPIKFPIFFGIVELVLVSMMGLSMVIWLLEDEHERLQKANKELDNFLYRTSHDLRSPLATVLGITNLSKYEIQDEVALKYISIIEERIKKLDNVISDILNLMREKKLKLHLQSIDFNTVVHETVTDIKLIDGAVNVLFDYPKESVNFLNTDYEILKTVLVNIITNSVRYRNDHQERPFVKISFVRTDTMIEIIVSDNGQGIHTDSLNRIFDMFYRANSSIEGTGLGLYIVSEALARINGKITVQSEFGYGSTFKITLPDA